MFAGIFSKTRKVRKHVYMCARQLGKSTSISASILMNCWWRSYFRVMYVAPLSIYTQRLHSMFMAPMTQGKLLPWPVVNNTCTANVNEKSYVSGSRFVGISCFNNVSNSLGVTTDEVYLDECNLGSTALFDGINLDTLVDKKPGDRIVGFNESTLKLEYDTIKSIKHKGKRHVWRIILSNGDHLDCTGNERIMSDRGWIYLAEILPWHEANRCPRASKAKAIKSQSRANGLWDTIGRFLSDKSGWYHSKIPPQVLRNTRPVSGTILQPQSGSVGGPSEDKAQDCREQGLGGEKLRFWIPKCSMPRLYTPDLLHGYFRQGLAKEEGNSRMGQTLDLGSDCVVDDGRWEPIQYREKFCVQYPIILKRGIQSIGELVKRKWSELQSHKNKEEKQEQDVLHNHSGCGWDQGALRKHQDILIPRDGVQVGLSGSKPGEAMQALWATIRGEWDPTVLWREVQCYRQEGSKDKMGGKESRRHEHKTQREILGELRGFKKKGKGNRNEAETGSSAPCKTDTKKERKQTQEKGSTEDFSDIVGIAYLGVDDVYDIETEKNHTFFANGIGVHNCQDLNADFIPQIRETLGTSDYRYESYFGTARGVDNTLTKLFENSTQNEWIMKCGCGHENVPTEAGRVLEMIQIKGICCIKCGKVIDVTRGKWIRSYEYDPIHRDSEGYHVPQIIVPDRIFPHDRYIETIYNKLHGSSAYSQSRFLQECLGIPTSQGGVPITQKDIKEASILDIDQHEPPNAQIYHRVAGGVDWGGAEVVSFTVGVAVGYRDGCFDVLGAIRPTGLPDEQRHYVIGDYLKSVTGSRIEIVGADAGFVGSVQNPNLGAYMGVPTGSIAYGTTKKFFMPNTNNCFTVDRTTLIYIVFTLIKAQRIRFPKGGWFEQYSRDLLATFTEDATNSHGATIRRYSRYQDKPDDFLHALGYAIFMAALGITDLPSMAGMATNLSINASYINDIGMEVGRFGNY